ncbi:hypothetical protein HY988_01045 [Candidatus Micrarchaeota archaeon]|nr:hypothetical protein [Candidatus Micrarchaeota archaeon]
MNNENTVEERETQLDRSLIRIAYFLTSKELTDEPIADPERFPEVNETHRGNLPRFAAMVQEGRVAGAELALIVMDDDTPHRDFSDLGLETHVEPSSAFKRAGKRGTPERDAAKKEYETRLATRLNDNGIDLILCDRYMIIHGSTMLDAFFGLMTNTHPARLPNIPGAFPTVDALKRARKEGIWFTGNTLHMVDEG